MALITSNISGSSNNNARIGITGSVIIANTSEFPSLPGSDISFFVSGSNLQRAVFGGDTVVSGTLVSKSNLGVTGSLAISNLSIGGGVLYASTTDSGKIIQNSNLTFNDSLNYFGAGVTTPARNLHANVGLRIGVANYIELIQANSQVFRFTPGGSTTTLEMNNDVILPPSRSLGFQPSLSLPYDSSLSWYNTGVINVSGSAPGVLFRFNTTSMPTSAGLFGMNTSSGRPTAYISGSARQLAHIDEIAPVNSTYITIGNDSTLTNERALTAGMGLLFTDGGAGGLITLAIDDSLIATVSGTTFTGNVTLGGSNNNIGGAGSCLGFFGATPSTKDAVADITNNVTTGGSTNTLTNFTDLSTYANDAATIRNNFHQIGLKFNEILDALQAYGLV